MNFKCKDRIPVGTIVNLNCKYGSQRLQDSMNVKCQPDGTWTNIYALKDYCTELCGIDETDSTLLSKNAPTVHPLKSPWTVPLYTRNGTIFKRTCSGVRIKSNLVLTAAHCLYTVDNKILSEALIRVGNSLSDQTVMDNDYNLDLVDLIIVNEYV